MKKDKKIALYVRVSTGYQIDRDSLPFQKKELTAYCEHILHNKNYEIFEDAGKSGKNTDRPGFQRMMKKIYNKEISHVIVYKIDRISRNLVDFSIMYQELKKYHVTFISLNEQFDTSNAMGEAMLKIILVFAELERNMTSERVTDVMVNRAIEGKWNGARMAYGWRWNSETELPEHDPDEAIYAKKIYETYIKTQSTGKVRDYCFENNIKTKRGGKWTTSTLANYIRNPLNKGDYRYNYRHSARGDKKDENEMVYLKGVFPPLVEPDIWDQANRIMDENYKKMGTFGRDVHPTKDHVFGGLVKCKACDVNMIVVKKDKKRENGFQPTLYVCSYRRTYRSCDQPYASEVKIGPVVFNYISNMIRVAKNRSMIRSMEDLEKELLSGPEFDKIKCIHHDDLSLIFSTIKQSRINKDTYMPEPIDSDEDPIDIEFLERELQKTNRAIERLKKAFLFSDDSMPENEFLAMRQELTEEATKLKNQIEQKKIEQFESSSELSFVNPASTFLLQYHIRSGEHIDYPEFAASVDNLVLKDFLEKTIECVYALNRRPVEIRFKNGLRTRFIYKDEK